MTKLEKQILEALYLGHHLSEPDLMIARQLLRGLELNLKSRQMNSKPVTNIMTTTTQPHPTDLTGETPKHKFFKIGDKFTVPIVSAGHDHHKKSDVFEVLQIIKGETPQTTSYRVAVQGPCQWWPHSRCKAATRKDKQLWARIQKN